MSKLSDFIKDALSSDSSVSSKRIAGCIGWIACLVCVFYALFTHTDSPNIVDTLFVTSAALLGLDSVVSIFKK